MADYIDKRELECELRDLRETAPETFDAETAEQIQEIEDLLSELHWADDFTLVREEKFVEYAEVYANGLGPTDGWPYDHIDWEKAADSLRQDYRAVEFRGETYLVRG